MKTYISISGFLLVHALSTCAQNSDPKLTALPIVGKCGPGQQYCGWEVVKDLSMPFLFKILLRCSNKNCVGDVNRWELGENYWRNTGDGKWCSAHSGCICRSFCWQGVWECTSEGAYQWVKPCGDGKSMKDGMDIDGADCRVGQCLPGK